MDALTFMSHPKTKIIFLLFNNYLNLGLSKKKKKKHKLKWCHYIESINEMLATHKS